MKPTAPNLNARIKQDKPNRPIKPIIIWKNGPAYELLTKTY
jgi:hypothetical protein